MALTRRGCMYRKNQGFAELLHAEIVKTTTGHVLALVIVLLPTIWRPTVGGRLSVGHWSVKYFAISLKGIIEEK